MEAKGIVVRDRAEKSRLLPHDLLLRSRVTASIVRSTISDPKRSLGDGDHVRAFLLYRLYHGPDLRLLISLRGINSCSEEPLAARSSRSETIASVAPGGTCWKNGQHATIKEIASAEAINESHIARILHWRLLAIGPVDSRQTFCSSPPSRRRQIRPRPGTCDGVADAGHQLDGALTVAHAVWHFAGVHLGGRPREPRACPVAARFKPGSRNGPG